MNQKKAGSAPNDRKLLVIAFHYPPDNTSTGGLRTFKFTEYLLRHGWRSHVISVPTNLYRSLDPAGAARMPKEVTVERVWARDAKSVFGFRGVYPSWLGIPDRYWTWLFSGTRAGGGSLASGDSASAGNAGSMPVVGRAVTHASYGRNALR